MNVSAPLLPTSNQNVFKKKKNQLPSCRIRRGCRNIKTKQACIVKAGAIKKDNPGG